MVEVCIYVMCAFGLADFMKKNERISTPKNIRTYQKEVFRDKLVGMLLLFLWMSARQTRLTYNWIL